MDDKIIIKRQNPRLLIHIKAISLALSGFVLPWFFILLIPTADQFILFQPAILMFGYYPVAFILISAFQRKMKQRLIMILLVNILSFSVIISVMIGFAAIQYVLFYFFFILIGYYAMGLRLRARETENDTELNNPAG